MDSSLNLHRIRSLVRWSLAIDKPYLLKSAMSSLTIMALIVQNQNLFYALGRDVPTGMSVASLIAYLLASIAMGGIYIYMTFDKNREGLRLMTLLPASNLEKYLVRYLLYFALSVAFSVVCIVTADLLQYVVGVIIQRESVQWISLEIIQLFRRLLLNPRTPVLFLVMLGLWMHTCYLLGCTLFRPIKYGWVFTTIILLVLFVGLASWNPQGNLSYNMGFQLGHLISHHQVAVTVMLAILSIMNYMLSYRLFCSRQIVGKFFNRL